MQVAELLRTIREGQETLLDLQNEGGDSVKRIEISHRELPRPLPQVIPEPPIARAQGRHHIFNDVDTFAEYLNRNANKESSLVLADYHERTITAILDESSTTDREQVTLRAIEHPLFTPWKQMLDRPIPVLEFALFVMKYRRAVVEPDGRELALTFSQVKMSKAITLATGTGKKSLNGVMVDLEIAGERRGTPVELPEEITIQTPIFAGTSPQMIDVDLLVTNQGESVVVYATAADVEQQSIAGFEDLVDTLRKATGQLIGLGSVNHRHWATVKTER